MQYRMNEEIMRFSSDWFYGNQVESAPEVKYRSILDLDIPMTWIDTSEIRNEELEIRNCDNQTSAESNGMQGNHNSSFLIPNSSLFKEEFVGESFGRINKAEAELTLLALENYFQKIGKQRILDERLDVGVISPYRAQVQYLRRLFKKREFFKPYRSLISVNTVDGFQGQERDIILISLVRSNDEGQIGFLRDLRRMNVAITRARMKVIILGDASTLTRHTFYKKLYDYIEAL
jgi:superfamily I DNA and/or RNA helicase